MTTVCLSHCKQHRIPGVIAHIYSLKVPDGFHDELCDWEVYGCY